MPAKGSSTFAYPGSKVTIASWIIDHFPAHECYVEPFGGSGSIFMQKEQSAVEVFNDLDGEIVEFFEVLRDHGDELVDWLENVPYSREVFETWRDEYLVGEHPDDAIERVGRLFALRYMAFGGNMQNSPTFKTQVAKGDSGVYNVDSFRRATENLHRVRDRFQQVIIECQDYTEIFDRYDRPETLFYLDPPYVDTPDGKYYRKGSQFDHGELLRRVDSLEGYVIISYDQLPSQLPAEEYNITARDRQWSINEDWVDGSEKLVMNYDPDNVPEFSEPNQTTLGEMS